MINVTDGNFSKEVLESKNPVLVDFWATWCGPCKMLSPVIEAISKQYEGKVKVIKANIEDCSIMAAQYNVTSVPTLMLFRSGIILFQKAGVQPKEVLEKLLDSFLN